jgi:hypothetical protein
MNSGLDKNKSVLGILVLSRLFHMSSDIDGLFNEAVDILWDFRGAT